MKNKKKAGISIVEVIIAVAIFALVFAPMIALMTHSIKMDRRALMHGLATYQAQLKLEEAYGMSVADLFTNYDSVTDSDADFDYFYSVEQYPPATFVLTSTSLPPEGLQVPGTRHKVTVSITSNEYGFTVTVEEIM